ncbi:MAG: FAD binding domain-containing protein [Myxococcales bacterium]|nr:FAD binding domain-containing protein [Myxococcales bacterium]
MLVLPELEVARPRSLEAALGALAVPPGEAAVLAGGTDLLPALKLGLRAPRLLVSLRALGELRAVREVDGALHVGAGVTLADLAADARVRAHAPAVADAAGLVGSPQVRNMGTLGGNLCLDTRCGYYDQTEFWRDALGNCLRTTPVECHVVPGGKNCVAAFSADTPPPLLALGAHVRLASEAGGERLVPLRAFYTADGIENTERRHDELVVGVVVPAEARRARTSYQKLRLRQAIDFPLLGVAAAAWLDGAGRVERLVLVVTALGAKPRFVGKLEELVGEPLDARRIARAAERARAQCHPLTNLATDTAWRRDMTGVLVRRALEAIA